MLSMPRIRLEVILMPMSSLLRKITMEYERRGYPKHEAQRISRAIVYGRIERRRRRQTRRKAQARRRRTRR